MDRTTTVMSGWRTPIIILLVLVPGILSQAAPSSPTITSPTAGIVPEGSVVFTCETIGGNPTPSVRWFKNNTLVDDTSFTDSSSGFLVHKNIYTANIQFSDKSAIFRCEVENSATSSPLTATKSFSDVYVSPSSPVLQGNSAVQANVSQTWTCYTNRSYPIPTISWRLDSQAFSQGISTSVSQNTDATYFVTSVLTYTPVSGDNGKVLKCEIEHSQTLTSSIERTLTLQITGGGAPIISTPQTSYTISTGTSVTLSCSYTSTTTVSSVYWEVTKGGTTTTVSTSATRFSGSTVSSPSLVISNAQTDDSGTYRCFAVNTLSTGGGFLITLTVSGGNTPTLTIGASSYSVAEGGTATLGCSVSSSPTATSFYWSKITNGVSTNVSTSGNSRYSGGTLTSPSLVITNLARSDAGSYRCNAGNSVGTGTSGLTNLITMYAPENVAVSPTSLTRDEGQSITATCTANGIPNPTFTWVKVSTNQQYSSNGTLFISNIDRGHDGDYRCTASNSQGSASPVTMTVTVRYRPVSTVTSAQSSVTLSSGQSQTLQCNTVSNPSVTSYQWRKDGVLLTSATSLTYTVTISSSSDYGTYSCYATNDIGQSNAIPFAVSSGVTGTTAAPSTGASTADTGLSSGTIAAIILAILFILLVLLLVICCCCMKGVCGKKQTKKKIVPTEIKEEPKEIIRTIEIPRYVEKPVVYEKPPVVYEKQPVVYREPVYRETYREPSAVSRQDVVIAEENFDILKYQTIPPSGTSLDGADSLDRTHRHSYRATTHLPALEYTVEAPVTADDEERRRRRRSKKRRRRHREEGEGEEREHRSTSRRRHRRKRREEAEGEPIITNGDIYYRNYSNNADTSEQYYYN